MSENTRIDPYSCVPRYHQLFAILKQKIDEGEWKRNESIPSERSLELMYNVSRTTIRQTLDLLSDYGYIYREHGRGTFVAPAIMQNSVNELISFSDDMSSRGFQPGQRILKIEYIEPSSSVRKKLELDATINTVLYIERVRLADGIPIAIQYAYVPMKDKDPITELELEQAGSLYKLMESKYNLMAVDADETIEATIAGALEAQLLEIKEGSPLLLVERTSWSQDRLPMEFVRLQYRADRYKYFAHLSRRES